MVSSVSHCGAGAWWGALGGDCDVGPPGPRWSFRRMRGKVPRWHRAGVRDRAGVTGGQRRDGAVLPPPCRRVVTPDPRAGALLALVVSSVMSGLFRPAHRFGPSAAGHQQRAIGSHALAAAGGCGASGPMGVSCRGGRRGRSASLVPGRGLPVLGPTCRELAPWSAWIRRRVRRTRLGVGGRCSCWVGRGLGHLGGGAGRQAARGQCRSHDDEFAAVE